MIAYRPLGRSGLQITELIFGNWVTHANQIADDTAIASVRAALDAGITTFDTADTYANTAAEVVLGKALTSQRRESLEIFTKVFFPTGPHGANDCGLGRKHIRESIDASLKRLQVEYVDLYQAHRYDYFTPLEETMLAFADVVRSGKALYIGVSEWTADQIRAAALLARELHVPLISNQPQYSALHRVIEAEVIPASLEAGLGQIVWSPIAQGVLSGKYLPGQAVPADSRAATVPNNQIGIDRFTSDQTLLQRVQQLRPLAQSLDLTMAQFALAWVLQNQAVSAAIIGASRPEQVVENVKASGVVIPAEVMAQVDQILGDSILHGPALSVSPRSR